jgi:hypothetical protein
MWSVPIARRLAIALFAVTLPLAASCARDSDRPISEQAPPASNVFIPDEQDLTDCVGTLDRPNCGSNEKGGWHFYLTMLALAGGIGFIGWRVTKGVRARDAALNATVGVDVSPAQPTDPSRTPPSR